MNIDDAQCVMVNGTEVLIEGHGEQVLLMLHGWPDSRALWNLQVAALSPHFRCVRFTWPGFDAATEATTKAGPRSLDELVALVGAVADRVSPGKPVTLVVHDWGCMFGYEFAARHPTRVSRIVAMDIGDFNTGALIKSLSLSAKLSAAAYQLWLAWAWIFGHLLGLHRLGNAMTRFMAKAFRAPGARESIGFGMTYPYAMTWFGLYGGLGKAAKNHQPTHPCLYFHALRKPFQFQSPQWLAAIAARPDSESHALSCGHWLMLQRADEVNTKTLAWLKKGV